MIVRVDIDNVAATIELDSEPWTPELVQTLLRVCGDEVIRAVTVLGVVVSEDVVSEDVVDESEE